MASGCVKRSHVNDPIVDGQYNSPIEIESLGQDYEVFCSGENKNWFYFYAKLYTDRRILEHV